MARWTERSVGPFLFSMANKTVIKCHNKEAHRRSSGEGKILAVFGSDCIYLHCKDRACRRWTRLRISFPGIKLDFSKAAIVQDILAKDYHFDFDKAAVVIGD